MNCEFLITAATSNSGKTTLTMGILRALSKRGLNVQPYKCGPDYIDTMFHRIASSNSSVNLDSFMTSRQDVYQLFSSYGQEADVRVVEGVMGLFDGYNKWQGSCAEIAYWLDLPIVLILSAQSVAYSVAPLIYGFKEFWPKEMLLIDADNKCIQRPLIAGVIFNMVASEHHFSFLRQACEDAGVTCFGYLRRKPELVVPSRHLGLTIEEQESIERLIEQTAEEVELHIDIDRLLSCCNRETKQHRVPETPSLCPTSKGRSTLPFFPFFPSFQGTPRILVARDEAFNFTYRAILDTLEKVGCVEYFSPLHDKTLPPCDWLYLPGGYPELFAQDLSANVTIRQAIHDYAINGGHVYSECGGFMYLCQDIDEQPMCGVLPLKVTMKGARLHLGYRQLSWPFSPSSLDNSTIASKMPVQLVRGHEFHYSSIVGEGEPETEKVLAEAGVEVLRIQRSALGRDVNTPIYHYKNVIAGYTHWYLR